MDWLEQVEKDLRWKEHDLGVGYLDRIIRLVFNEVFRKDVEEGCLGTDGVLENLLSVSEEPVDMEKLLTISTAITLKGKLNNHILKGNTAYRLQCESCLYLLL